MEVKRRKMNISNKKTFSMKISGGVSRIDIKKHLQDPDVKKMHDKLSELNIRKTKNKKSGIQQ